MNIDRPIWIVHLEVLFFNNRSCEEGKVGFVNAVLTAKDSFSAEERVARILMSQNCEILEISTRRALDVNQASADSLVGLVREVNTNPDRVAFSELTRHKNIQEFELAAIY
jgi:hypothetical protein